MKYKNGKGITLIALVITIIVLLILAGISISLLVGENGTLNKSKIAKVETEIAEEKEIIGYSVTQAVSIEHKMQLQREKFEDALEQNSRDENKATIVGEDEEYYFVQFAKDGRYYQVDKNGNVEYLENVTGSIKTLTIQCKNSKSELLEEKEYKILGNRYSKLPPQIDGYEAKDTIIEGAINNENEIVEIEYYKILTEDDLVFTAYTENEVEKYMIGTGTATAGNGLKEKTLKSVLYVPESHEGKTVAKIGRNSFHGANNIIKIVIKENIKSINHEAFKCCSNIKEVNLNCENIYSECVFGYNTTRIDKVFLGENVKRLDATTFNSSTLTHLIINSNYVELTNAIGGVIDNVEVNSNNTKYEVVDNVLYSKDRENRKIYMYPTGRQGDFVIPNDVKEIGRCAFLNAKLTNIEIPSNVKDVRHEAFKYASLQEASVYCDNIWDECVFGYCRIKTVRIGKNVKMIGGTTFNGDSNVQIIYEGTIEEWNKLVGNRTFNSVSKITCSDGEI